MDSERDTGKYTRLSGVWTDPKADPKGRAEWLVDFYLTDLDGKLECVGMTVRSFVLPEERDPAFLWGAVPDDSAALPPMSSKDARALRRRSDKVIPRPLRSAVLRADLLGKMLPALQAEAKKTLESLVAQWTPLGQVEVNVDLSAHRLGRPRKYERADLEAVAASFTKASARGSSTPYKDVVRELDFVKNRGVAGKLIMECRRIGLLPPSSRPRSEPKPKKSELVEHPIDADNAATPRETNERKEQK